MIKFEKVVEKETLSDDDNPLYLYITTNNSLLADIVHGRIDPIAMAKKELRNRGLDYSGKWIGFWQKIVSKKIYNSTKVYSGYVDNKV